MNLSTGFTPPRPKFEKAPQGGLAVIQAIRSNVLSLWPEEVYRAPSQELGLFGKKLVLLNQPDAISRVLVDGDDTYRRSPMRHRLLFPVVGNGLLLSEGDEWKHQRRTSAPAFAPRGVKMLNGPIAATITERLNHLDARPQQVELLPMMQDWAAEMSGRCMFSFSPHLDDGLFSHMAHEYVRRLATPTRLDILLPRNLPSPMDFPRRRFSQRWMQLINLMIGDRLALPAATPPRDLLDLLLAAARENEGQGIQRLRDQVATMIVAGHETTSVAMFWALYLLANCPGIQEAVAAEAGTAWEAGDITDLPSRLPLARAVVSEALRLYPPAFMIGRQAAKADEVSGIKIPTGSTVLVAPWVMHRHHDHWDRPDEFDPSRFMPGAPAPARNTYLPFGTGARVCIGAQFATAMATVAIAGLVRGFKVETLGKEPVMPVCVITSRPQGHPQFRLTPRSEAVALDA